MKEMWRKREGERLTKPVVVIVGASFAGLRVKKILKHQFDIKIIDVKGYFEYYPSTLKKLVNHKASKHVVEVEALCGRVLKIDQNKAFLEELEVPFKYLVIASGSRYKENEEQPIKTFEPSDPKQRLEELLNESRKLHTADTICLIGGGPVGVELCAEIVCKYKRKKRIILCTRASRLLNRMHYKCSKYAYDFLTKRGVQILFGVDASPVVAGDGRGWKIQTISGECLDADVVYRCYGQEACIDFLCPVSYTQKGISVKDTLQTSIDHIFAAGDVTDCGMEKCAFSADIQANIVAHNIIHMEKGEALESFPKSACYEQGLPLVLCISLSSFDGIMQINNLVIGGYLAAINKSIIELLQVEIAKGSWFAYHAWLFTENLLLFLACYCKCFG